jgi:hypothetical protein
LRQQGDKDMQVQEYLSGFPLFGELWPQASFAEADSNNL